MREDKGMKLNRIERIKGFFVEFCGIEGGEYFDRITGCSGLGSSKSEDISQPEGGKHGTRIQVTYDGEIVGEFVADVLVEGVILELKSVNLYSAVESLRNTLKTRKRQ